jgi:tRNA-2-methylthio-N6-dimethylallyladenosine synthase
MYLERVQWIRNVRPEICFSTDIIVGFPGESEQDFELTCDLVMQMKYAFIYAFAYSQRTGTAAARFKDQVPEEVKKERLQRLLAIQKSETERQNLAEIGHVRKVFPLYFNRKEPNSIYGRTYEGRLVKVHTDQKSLGGAVPVRIVSANVVALEGVLA